MSSGARDGLAGMTDTTARPAVDAGATATAIVDANAYLVLATADPDGRPWSSPVWFAHAGDSERTEFFWISAPDVQHSRNIATRPEVGIVVFDSHARIGTGQAAYFAATAAQVVDAADLERGLEVFTRRSRAHGGRAWTAADVTGESGMRFYRAIAQQRWVLAKDGKPDHRIPA